MSLAERIGTLRHLVRLITDSSEVVIREWQTEETEPSADSTTSLLPSPDLFNARRTVLGACGMVSDVVAEPQHRLMEFASEYHVSRALHVAAEGRIPDILADANPAKGLHVKEIAQQAGIEHRKLARILRCLASIHVFKEVKELHFSNTRTSQALVDNDPLRCWLMANGSDIYTASSGLLKVLFDPVRTTSYSLHDTAFNEAHRTKSTFWEFLEQGEKQPDGTVNPRRRLEIFGLAMLGGGRVHGPPLYVDYPWAALSSGTVVDVGGGIGGMSLELAKRYPNLKFVLQDRLPVIEKAKAVWEHELPEAVESKRIAFMEHDFFKEQPIKGAEVYFMRNVLHDWPDSESCAILKHLYDSMGPRSRILTADQVIHSTIGSRYLSSAPSPLPANYGYAHKLAHIRDMNMMTLFNGMERSPEDLDALAQRVSLKVAKVWECRGMISITEMRRHEDITADPAAC
ncbi:S-adenosyl-L-methionine-dependent methyltransferase [Fomitopsis serialis]|uniref:S-adenosyl-L-methionine-dependent methyltransferase n=1 Tax=Fomitopsis serialis TaxID=139415 RepID=UPI002008770B|nr:S-adenosyl-L-methionine-dependent methyltransferase [Neoantrodia serialis]KAH9927650.1 S-adenosyl-L-methionine-dependent methyltransferase [Neoantrodia serialis]